MKIVLVTESIENSMDEYINFGTSVGNGSNSYSAQLGFLVTIIGNADIYEGCVKIRY